MICSNCLCSVQVSIKFPHNESRKNESYVLIIIEGNYYILKQRLELDSSQEKNHENENRQKKQLSKVEEEDQV